MVKFAVNDVTLGPRLPRMRQRRLLTQLCSSTAATGRLEAHSLSSKARYVKLEGSGNPLLASVHMAFSKHYPLVLSPDAIWLTILQGVAAHINASPEQFRDLFVSHEGKKEIEIVRDQWAKGDAKNDWASAAAEMVTMVECGFKEQLNITFSTTGPNELAALQMTFMECVKAYFAFRCMTCCGIPWIELEGTTADWQRILDNLPFLNKLGLTHWRTQLEEILQHFVRASAGDADIKFWNRIYYYHGPAGSGGANWPVTGWFSRLFLHLHGGEKNPAVWEGEPDFSSDRPSFSQGPDPDKFPRGMTSTPFLWEVRYPTLMRMDMTFNAGLLGVTQDPKTRAVKAQLGWLVMEPCADGESGASWWERMLLCG